MQQLKIKILSCQPISTPFKFMNNNQSFEYILFRLNSKLAVSILNPEEMAVNLVNFKRRQRTNLKKFDENSCECSLRMIIKLHARVKRTKLESELSKSLGCAAALGRLDLYALNANFC